ncbi:MULTISPECIES: DUF2986 domain-containing protein [Corallincola]|uniref:DUF2986 domain-containing protein n=3 Tax=Corallincola TaxID=1775176 RepID=A0A368N732_9GAMM|nr:MULTISPECIES: DUF2986 domain-containing protein [Corallincola]RCU45335.1 DUF2986 domain-containing protein [Corallincola holothuriorum]TAA42615.1 DUF2986 domain-containing protein [Corallincola spongiicola]TCI01271.1 DUF2986 domain-containing protein [Corallincola luteus]
MNRKKKINETLKKRLKRKVDRQKSTNKPRYISKAEREKLALAEASATEQSSSSAADVADSSDNAEPSATD